MSRSPLLPWSLALCAGILCSRLAAPPTPPPREPTEPRLVRIVGEVRAAESLEPGPDGRPRQRIWLRTGPGDVVVVVGPFVQGAPLPGARVAATGLWLALPPAAAGERWAARPERPAQGLLRVDGPLALTALSPAPAGPAAWLARSRDGLGRRIAAALGDRRVAGLARALLLGQRDGLASDLSRDFQRSGLLHILAVSGQHVGIVVFLVGLVLRGLGLSPRARRLTLIPAAWLYVLLAGAGAPALRAGLMLTAYLLTADTRARRRGLEALALAALVILVRDPQELFRVGFQLSALATAGIVCFTEAIAAAWPAGGGPLPFACAKGPIRALGRSLAVSLAAFLGAAPCLAWHFHQITPWAPLLSVLAAPLVVFLIGGALLAAALGPWSPAALGTVMGWASAALEAIVGAGAALPGASVPVAAPVVTFAVAAAAVWALRCDGRRRLAAAALPLAWALLPWCSLGVGALVDRPRVAIDALRVGHGCAVLVRLDGRALLYDCGGLAGDPWRIGQRVASELIARGVRRLDLLVLSHADADHINGVRELSRRLAIARVLVPGTLADDAVGRALLWDLAAGGTRPWVQRQPRWSLLRRGDIELASLALVGPAAASRNEGSLVLLLRAGGARAVLAGDLEDWGSRLLAQELADRPCDLLLLPHHGRATDATVALARSLAPREAWASCGRPDRSTRSTLRIFGLFGARTRTTWAEGDLHWTPDRP